MQKSIPKITADYQIYGLHSTYEANIGLTISKLTYDAVTNCILTLELSVGLVLAILATVVVISETNVQNFSGNSSQLL